MKTNELETERLRKLANHLLFGKLKTSPYIIGDDPTIEFFEDYREEKISLFFYVLEECAHLFPGWKDNGRGSAYWVKDPLKADISSAMLFFGLSYEMVEHFLAPYCQNKELYGGKTLNKDSSPQDVGFNILEFLKIVS